jgi:hypothetical protein
MEEKKATQVGCQSCKDSKKIQETQKFVFIYGAIGLFLMIYGVVNLIKDVLSLF